MDNSKDQMVVAIANGAHRHLGQLAGELVGAAPHDKESILAEMDYRHWLVGACLISLDRS